MAEIFSYVGERNGEDRQCPCLLVRLDSEGSLTIHARGPIGTRCTTGLPEVDALRLRDALNLHFQPVSSLGAELPDQSDSKG